MSIGSDLLRFSDRKAFLFDFESQRLCLLEDNLPFEVSYMVADRRGTISTKTHYLKWPNFKMSADAARITRFQQSWVDNGDDPREVLEEFESYIFDPQYDICGQAILSFDVYIHQLWRRALGLKPDFSYLSRLYDTNLLSRAYKMGWKPDRENLLAWQYKVMAGYQKGIKTNLGLMAKELGMEVDESKQHGAAYDLQLNAFVHYKIINLIEI